MKKLFKLYSAIVLILSVSCQDFIDVDPPKTQIVPATVFQSEASAASAVRGIYSLMMTNTSFTRGGLEEYTGTASDELINYSTTANRLQFYQNSITPINSDLLTLFWTEAYKYISNANVIIEGLEKSNIGNTEKQRLIGEAMFVRSFCYYYLANLFGDVPYLTSSNYETNSKAPRTPYDQVMAKVEAELESAREKMTTDFATSFGERTRPNRFAAIALLGRVYLYRHQWAKAEQAATEIINNEQFMLLDDLSAVFLANSTEAIWQLQPVTPNTGAPQATLFVLTAAPNGVSRRVALRNELISSFEDDDLRKQVWIRNFTNASGTWNFSYKYTTTNSPVEYTMMFRLAEQYLIRAEARVQLENFDGSLSDLNSIRRRAGLTDFISNNKSEIMDAIWHERKLELFGENGHRWLDLKRSGKIDATLSPLKPQWTSTDALWPIPNSERLINTNLSQNPGY